MKTKKPNRRELSIAKSENHLFYLTLGAVVMVIGLIVYKSIELWRMF